MVISRAAIAVGNSRRPQTPALVLRAPDRAKGQLFDAGQFLKL
jgi:hypothetical protein